MVREGFSATCDEGLSAEALGAFDADLDLPTRDERELDRIRRISWWSDAALRVPGTRFRVGYDALLGLLPGVGDIAGAGLSLYLIATAARLKIGKRALARMTLNAGVEAIIGMIPLVGDLFDAIFKANLRNTRILENALRQRNGASLSDSER